MSCFVYCLRTGPAVYSGYWSPESDQVIYTSGRNLVIKPLKSGLKPSSWAAHDGLVLCLDWSSANGLIVSAGEDSKYKVTGFIHDVVWLIIVELLLSFIAAVTYYTPSSKELKFSTQI